MNKTERQKLLEVGPEQQSYAHTLTWGGRLFWGLTVLALAVSQFQPVQVSWKSWPELWGLSAADLRFQLGEEFFKLAPSFQGDALLLSAFAILALSPFGGFIRLAHLFIRRRDYLYGGIAIAQSGLLALVLVLS